MPTKRYIANSIQTDLKKKMVFIGGPRQVGKTTLALQISHLTKQSENYLNWDVPQSQSIILKNELPLSHQTLIFDEIHKYARWRNYLKGLFDKYYPEHRFLITGSARLDHYRKGGDSLLGRYHYYRLHPFSLLELNKNPSAEDLKVLMKFGGFPEPLFEQSETGWRRWQKERVSRVIEDDLRNLELVKEISLIHALVEMLPERVGSPLSIQSIREDLAVSHEAADRWVTILDNIYMTFRIAPYGTSAVRAVKKEQKLYFWDWSQVGSNPAAKFENLVASHLLKYCHFIEDTQGYRMELRFLRDRAKREIDFVVIKDKKPEFAVECKSGERSISPNITYFSARTPIPRFYQVHLGQRDYGSSVKGGRVLPFVTFCKEVGIP